MLYHFFPTRGRQAALLGDDLAENQADIASHVGCVTTNVEAGLLLDEVEHERRVLTELVLDVDLLVRLAGEGRDDFQGVAELVTESLKLLEE